MAGREINERLLRLAGFEDDAALEEFLPDWLHCADTFGLSDEDVRFAVEEWIPDNWDVKYCGIRKMIGAWLRVLADLANTPKYKAEGKKILYGILPSSLLPFDAFKLAGGDDVYVSFPDLTMIAVLNGFFHKAAPLLDKAENSGFNYGCRHCPLNKLRYIGYKEDIIAAPDVIWVWGLACDEGPKTDEFISNMVSEDWKCVISRLPHDTCFDDDDVSEERVRYLSEVLHEDIDKIADTLGIHPTDADFTKAQNDNRSRMFKVAQLTSLVCNSDPVPLGGNDLTMISTGFAFPINGKIGYFDEALDILLKEIKAAIKAGEGILPKGAPKIGNYFTSFCNPWIDRTLRKNGVAQTFCMTMTMTKKQLAPPQFTENVYMSMAENWLRNPTAENLKNEVDAMVEKVLANKPDGMLMGFYDYDRWLGSHHKMAAELIEKETGVPTYYIEGDCMDDREYSYEALATRIESICEVMHMRKDAQ